MRTFKLILALTMFGFVFPVPIGAADTSFTSPRAALKQGMSAMRGGYYELAIPALEYASSRNVFLAKFHLARIYADNSSAHTNHRKAYELYERLALDHIDADPDDDPRAPYVGKALTALALYLRRGIPEAGVKKDQERSVFYLRNASKTFNDEDAQFELAKLQLQGDGFDRNVPLGKYWIGRLSKRGHAGAQAFFADLLWRGRHVKKDPPRALALIALARKHAPSEDRLWIEDIYQNIYCGVGEGVRYQATGLVAQWGNRYGRKRQEIPSSGTLGQLAAAPVRTCKNGEAVGNLSTTNTPDLEALTVKRRIRSTAPVADAPTSRRGFTFGTASGPGLREVDATMGTTFAPDN